MFERSQVKHNSLDCHFFSGIFSINSKDYMLKAWHKSNLFLHVQNTQTSRVDNPYFFQMFFLSTKCAPFFLKFGKELNIDY
jgi:hypothetical protein